MSAGMYRNWDIFEVKLLVTRQNFVQLNYRDGTVVFSKVGGRGQRRKEFRVGAFVLMEKPKIKPGAGTSTMMSALGSSSSSSSLGSASSTPPPTKKITSIRDAREEKEKQDEKAASSSNSVTQTPETTLMVTLDGGADGRIKKTFVFRSQTERDSFFTIISAMVTSNGEAFRVFSALDDDGNGYLDAEEIRKALTDAGLSTEGLEGVSSRMTFEEFLLFHVRAGRIAAGTARSRPEGFSLAERNGTATSSGNDKTIGGTPIPPSHVPLSDIMFVAPSAAETADDPLPDDPPPQSRPRSGTDPDKRRQPAVMGTVAPGPLPPPPPPSASPRHYDSKGDDPAAPPVGGITGALQQLLLKKGLNHGTTKLDLLKGERLLFPALSRENVQLLAHTPSRVGLPVRGSFAVTNYRILFTDTPHGARDNVEITLGALSHIEQTSDASSSSSLTLYTKEYRRCTFAFNVTVMGAGTKPMASFLHGLISEMAFPGADQTKSFAFSHSLEGKPELDGWNLYVPTEEYDRMGVDVRSGPIRLCTGNIRYVLSPTYPSVFLTAAPSDQKLVKVATFRSRKRFPIIVYRHRRTGATLSRCAQPLAGISGHRCEEDEDLITAIRKANTFNNSLLYLVDFRPFKAAVGNKIMGKGTENAGNYPGTQLVYMNIDNIHAVRTAMDKVTTLCADSIASDAVDWGTRLEDTQWLLLIRNILSSAVRMVSMFEEEGTSIVCHCSDGWDRTSQVCALVELLLDPYYRTRRGFAILIEQEWLALGHKFAERHGHADGKYTHTQRAPVFQQWLDCVWQITRQYPLAFEFNEDYLLAISEHLLSCRFGTFLYDSEAERAEHNVRKRTVSLWTWMLDPENEYKFKNPCYRPDHKPAVLIPNTTPKRIVLWEKYFFRFDAAACVKETLWDGIAQMARSLPMTSNVNDVNTKLPGMINGDGKTDSKTNGTTSGISSPAVSTTSTNGTLRSKPREDPRAYGARAEVNRQPPKWALAKKAPSSETEKAKSLMAFLTTDAGEIDPTLPVSSSAPQHTSPIVAGTVSNLVSVFDSPPLARVPSAVGQYAFAAGGGGGNGTKPNNLPTHQIRTRIGALASGSDAPPTQPTTSTRSASVTASSSTSTATRSSSVTASPSADQLQLPATPLTLNTSPSSDSVTITPPLSSSAAASSTTTTTPSSSSSSSVIATSGAPVAASTPSSSPSPSPSPAVAVSLATTAPISPATPNNAPRAATGVAVSFHRPPRHAGGIRSMAVNGGPATPPPPSSSTSIGSSAPPSPLPSAPSTPTTSTPVPSTVATPPQPVAVAVTTTVAPPSPPHGDAATTDTTPAVAVVTPAAAPIVVSPTEPEPESEAVVSPPAQESQPIVTSDPPAPTIVAPPVNDIPTKQDEVAAVPAPATRISISVSSMPPPSISPPAEVSPLTSISVTTPSRHSHSRASDDAFVRPLSLSATTPATAAAAAPHSPTSPSRLAD